MPISVNQPWPTLRETREKNNDDYWQQKLRGRRVFIETYGCRYNFGDTAKLVEVLKNLGSIIVDSADRADSVVVNTCTVVGPTERRMLRRLSLYRDNDLYVTGCMPVVQPGPIFAVCSPTIITGSIQEAYRDIGTVTGKAQELFRSRKGVRAPFVLYHTGSPGPLKSFPEDEILRQVLAHSRAGTAEIQITAQDVSAWGRDLGRSLRKLLGSIGNLPGSSWYAWE